MTPRVIAHIGEDLIKNESIALLELVKNANDADASHCAVNFTFDQVNKLQSISVEDDGCGMTIGKTSIGSEVSLSIDWNSLEQRKLLKISK